MSKSDSKSDKNPAADEAAAAEAAQPAAAKNAKVSVLSKGKTNQVVTDGVRVWKEAIK